MTPPDPVRRRLLAALPGLLLAELAGCATLPPPVVLDGDDRRALAGIEAYLNGIRTMHARFAQPGAQGEQTGTVWVERPGRMRLEYDPPSRVTLVAAHGRVLFANRDTGARSSMPLARTPLSILLAERIALSGPVRVVDLRRNGDAITLELRSTEHPGQGALTLHLAASPLALRGLVLADGRGDATQLDFSLVRTGIPIDPGFFMPPA